MDIQGHSRIFKDIQGHSRIFKDIQGYSRTFKDIQGHLATAGVNGRRIQKRTPKATTPTIFGVIHVCM